MNYDAEQIKEKYNPDNGDIAVGRDGQFIHVTWAEYALLQMVEKLAARVETLERERGQVMSKVDCRGANFRGVKGATIAGTVINSG